MLFASEASGTACGWSEEWRMKNEEWGLVLEVSSEQARAEGLGVASLKIIQKSNIKSFSLTFWSKLRHLVTSASARHTGTLIKWSVAYGEKSYKSIQIKQIYYERVFFASEASGARTLSLGVASLKIIQKSNIKSFNSKIDRFSKRFSWDFEAADRPRT